MSEPVAIGPVQQAYRNLEEFRDVRASPQWQRMAGLMRDEMAKLTQQVMESDLTPEQRDQRIAAYRAIKNFATMPEQQIQTIEAYTKEHFKANANDDAPP
ncbi:MAG: hypothetical protein IPM06_18470 [Rhizobiales bacterium]|nr:hypothetical protein [Hyphomicrobiales bacterium]